MPENNSYTVEYSVSLIGSLKSHLKGLLGYDTMIMELMQNADDAQAEEMVFDIRDECLQVTNNAEFKYCGNLQGKCSIESKCDFHRIFEFASGLKEKNSENIGRFGIGFASVYQITDRPKIISHGISAEFHPETGLIDIEELLTDSTVFNLPWAKNPDSNVRLELGLGSIDDNIIDKIYNDSKSVFNESLLFLRHLRRVELKRNGKSSLIVTLNRKLNESNHELSISFIPHENPQEQWIIFENKCSNESVSRLKQEFPLLAIDNRKSSIQIAIKTDSIPIKKGLIYAYLPTKQASLLPLHINADFYPDPSRKSINLTGGQHQQKWNELLIDEAAQIIVNKLEIMTKHISHTELYKLLLDSWLARNEDYPFASYWDWIRDSIKDGAKVFYSSQDEYEKSDNMAFDKLLGKRKETELSMFYRSGGKLLHNDFNNPQYVHQSIGFLEAIGIFRLSVEKFGKVINKSELLKQYKNEGSIPTEKEIDEIFVPLWSYADVLIDRENADESIVGPIEFALTSAGNMTSIDSLRSAPKDIKNSELATILKLESFSIDSGMKKLAHDKIGQFKSLYKRIQSFNLYSLVDYLETLVEADKSFAQILIISNEDAKIFYELIVTLDSLYVSENNEHDSLLNDLKNLPIWKTHNSFSNLQNTLLPGNFDDPIGDSQMLDSSFLSPMVEKFIEKKLEVKRQTIKAYIETMLPTLLIDGEWTKDNKTLSALILTFAKHENLLEDEETLTLLKETPLIPNKDGAWEVPSDSIYFYQKKLAELIGNDKDHWIDEKEFSEDKSIKKFFKGLGISTKPSSFILLRRMIKLSREHSPTPEVVQKSANAFYALCELYISSSDKDEFLNLLKDYKDNLELDEYCDCFPILNDSKNWHSSSEDIYEPYDYKSFESSNVNILAFTTLEKIVGCEELMQFFTFKKVEIDPVIEHLQNQIENNKPSDLKIYKVLSDLEASSADMHPNINWIYHSDEKKYIRPNQTFFKLAPIKKYTYTLPSEYLDMDIQLFEDIGVKNEPNIEDYINIILEDLVNHYGYSSAKENLLEQSSVSKNDMLTYIECVNFISENFNNSELQNNQIQSLFNSPSVLNHHGDFKQCNDILIDDSKWYRDFFESENIKINWLTDLTDINWHAFEEIGLKKLSKCVKLELVRTDGESKAENELIKLIRDRESLFLRAIPDQPIKIKRKLVSVINKIKISSFEKLIVRAHVNNNTNVQFSSDSRADKAFFNEIENELLVARSIGKNNFVALFKPILNNLLEEKDVKPTLAVFDAICSKPLDDGSAYLNELEYKNNDKLTFVEEEYQDDIDTNDLNEVIDVKTRVEENQDDIDTNELNEVIDVKTRVEENQDDIDTNDLDEVIDIDTEMGENQDNMDTNGLDEVIDIDTEEKELIEVSDALKNYPKNPQSDNVLPEFDLENKTIDINVKNDHIEKLENRKNPRDRINNNDYSGNPGKKTDGKSTESAQQKLTSYTYAENKPNHNNNGNNEINLEIEVKSRAIVVEHEKKRGRAVEEMSQDNPGFDLISTDKETGEVLRYIEVKGTIKKWGERGVSVSYTQFSHAQDKGDKAWLYVVDDIDGDSPTLYRIQDFAIKTKSIMYDSGWINTLEEEDDFLNYGPGVFIEHEGLGKGEILSIDQSSPIFKLKIKYKNGITSTKPLNKAKMKIIKGDS